MESPGGPRTVIELSERELAMPEYRQPENSGFSLSLVLAGEPPEVLARLALLKRFRLPRVEYPWLEAAKLGELGFKSGASEEEPAGPYAREAGLSRRAYIVLEVEGPAWAHWLAGREGQVANLRTRVEEGEAERGELRRAEAVLALDSSMRSRLFPVDAGTDLASLQRRYADSHRYLIVPGAVSLVDPEPGGSSSRLVPRIDSLVTTVHVGRAQRLLIERLLPPDTWEQAWERDRKMTDAAWPAPVAPRYRAKLAFGRGLEPWLLEVTPDPVGNTPGAR